VDGRQTLDLLLDLGSAVTINAALQSAWAVLEFRGYLVVNAKS
jgi:hypothetical protein